MKHKISLILLAFYFIASPAFAQVDKLTGTITNDATMARLRLAHFVFGAANVDWYVNGKIAVNGGQDQVNIPVGYVNGYLYLEPGTYSFTVTPTGKDINKALLETDVDVVAGHRYSLVILGQVEDEKLSPLVIDETAELQKVGAAKDQVVVFGVNNLAGTNTLEIDVDGHGPKGIPYGGLVTAPLQSGKYGQYAFTVNGDPDAVLDKGNYTGDGELPGTDYIRGFFGRYPGNLGTDFDYSNASPYSEMTTLEVLQGFKGAGVEGAYQAVTFETFLKAVEVAGLTDLLTTGDPLLVLPPTDVAFAELPKEQLDALMADPDALAKVLRNHIVEAYVPKGALAKTPGGSFYRSFTNMLGETTLIGDGYTVNGMDVGSLVSIFTRNGTQVHPITKVLLPPSLTLRLAVADDQDRPSTPYVMEFIEQVKTLSNGTIIIEPIWGAGGDTEAGFEMGVIEHLKKGDYELGLAAARAWNKEGITSFDALQAPFLIDNDALAEAVASSDVATRMLDNLGSSGLAGLALWPEDLRHPFAIPPQEPLLSPEDFAGLDIRATSSGITYSLIEALNATPVFRDVDYEGAESGLRQGFSLMGTPIATGNVVFFPKFQVLFANGENFNKLSEEQKSILREAAKATQEKAIAEHPREVDAATAWCADGGSIVMATEEQIAAFKQAAQPIFDQISQDPNNADLIGAIRDLKASTEPSPGAEACASATASSSADIAYRGTLPPNGKYRREITEEDILAKTGDARFARDLVRDNKGVVFWDFEDGKVYWDDARQCYWTYSSIDDVLTWEINPPCNNIKVVLKTLWRELEDGSLDLFFLSTSPSLPHDLVNDRAYFEGVYQKVEEWSEGLPPNGTWQVELTVDDLIRMDMLRSNAIEWAGVHTWTFQDGKATWHQQRDAATSFGCEATFEAVEDFVRITYTRNSGDCGGGHEVDDIQWRLEDDGLHLHLVAITNAPFDANRAYLEAKPWKKIK